MDAAEPDDSPLPPLEPRDIDGTGVTVSPLGLDGSIFGWAAGIDDTANLLDLFHAEGGNFISTADHYAGGRSEIMIGNWVRTLPDRASVVLATKVGRHPDAPGLSPHSILRAAEASLERLGTDYIDFLSFDGEDAAVPIEESLEAGDRLVREGKVRFLSASEFSPASLQHVRELAESAAYPQFRALVVKYNLMDRKVYERDYQEIACRNGRGAIARVPLAGGFLTGLFRSKDDAPVSLMYEGALDYLGRRGTRVLDALDEIAAETGHRPARIALAWAMLKPGIAAVAVRVKDPEQLSVLLEAVNVRLTRHQVSMLDRASAY
ncbi:MAG: aldo/keto reductase [Glaciihabitans sp.]|jgi:aryl-alcohol dehydrogenase-like predicted oxidoreductase|nr:aldo/keto reductase [Glaciihabitans sp.]MDQ1555244.1 hypothetical protein [Actinomycetota bacterium]